VVKEAPKPLVVSLPDATATSTEETTEASTSTVAAVEEPKVNAQTLLGEKRVKGVDQPIRKIVVMNKFLQDDNRRDESESEDEEEGLLGEKADEDVDEDEDDEEDDVDADLSLSIPVIEGESEDESEDDLTWDDVNGGEAAAPSIPASAKGKGKAKAVDETSERQSTSISLICPSRMFALTSSTCRPAAAPAKRSRKSLGDEDDTAQEKEKRVTTSKKKAESFYTNANVKNRNRDKGRKEIKEDGGRARPGKKGAGMSGNIKAGGRGGRK
jgi:nuclear GTP-binding protein